MQTPPDDNYADPADLVKVRVYRDDVPSIDDGRLWWNIDAIDSEGRCSEGQWSAPTWAEAIALGPAFLTEHRN